jgi:hypothetical protein
MAKPKTALGTKVRILFGDGQTPENFTAFCGLTAKSIAFATTTNDFLVPDCDDPDAPAWRELAKSGRSVEITGSGILATDTLARYQAAYDSPNAINARVELAVPALDGGGHWEGAFLLTAFTINGNDGDLTQVDLTMQSSGPVIWVSA